MNPQPAAANEWNISPRCYRHPDRETAVSCVRCERPICPDCLRSAPVGFQCPDCVAKGAARAPTLPYGGQIAERAGLVTLVLGALNVAVFVITAVTSPGGVQHNYASRLFSRLVLSPIIVAEHQEYWRFLGSAFLHFGLVHLVLNMVSLALLGPPLERLFGAARYTAIYLVGALGGAVAVFVFGNPINNVAGASGAIVGLFGALIVVCRKLGLDMRALLPTIVINIYITFRIPDISWLGHLGGLVAGGLCAAVLMYAPKAQRLQYQILGVGLILGVLAALTVYRAGVLR
ncbi:MAG: rhomboid family intramembrane serine protease [Pseudonocardiales bacterium]|nr:MAG: rhomboid family intramembrane serine protease [Pseudonocardiales bacterium]